MIFNNLFVYTKANQETIVELVEFVKRIALQRNKKPHKGKLSPIEELNRSVSEKEVCILIQGLLFLFNIFVFIIKVLHKLNFFSLPIKYLLLKQLNRISRD